MSEAGAQANNPSQSWVWVSTPASFATGAISILALLETVVAMAAYGAIATRFGTMHLTLAALTAPFLLLRTDESVRFALVHSASFRAQEVAIPRGLPSAPKQSALCLIVLLLTVYPFCQLAVGSADKMSEQAMAMSIGMYLMLIFSAMVSLVAYVVLPLLMRILATAHGVYLSPPGAVSNIPRNWWRQVACLDSFHPPEILPGAILFDTARGTVSELQPYGFCFAKLILAFTARRNARDFIWTTMVVVSQIGSFLAAAVPAYLFRYAIKGTSLLLVPLVWLVYDARTTTPGYYVKSSLVQALYKGCGIVVITFFGAFLLDILGTDFALAEHLTRLHQLRDANSTVRAFFPPKAFPPWQAFLLALACLTMFSFHFAERLSVRGASVRELACFRCVLGGIGLLAVMLIFALLLTSAGEAIRGSVPGSVQGGQAPNGHAEPRLP